MRNEKEMIDLIVGIADKDERIRAVYMNGSRTNPNVEKDIYQDYDIVYVVNETETFINDENWIKKFGEIAIMQLPDDNDNAWGANHDFRQSYAWLMLFKDGNRIDLGIEIKEKAQESFKNDYDKLTIVLLDKDKILPDCPPPSDEDYWIKKPTREQYYAHCNDFWWCLNNVAKGIARDELPCAMWMYNVVVREHLEKMIEWHIGIKNNFTISVGKQRKYFKKYMTIELYELYKKTFSNSEYEDFWTAIFTACKLFEIIAFQVGEYLDFSYNENEGKSMIEYLKWVRNN
ncbi:MAG: aminoglycoside 6-adenylyltransferase [Oscillospiraceae bacterium]|nr:aminoglycoside 6-adenylyltransferase [Oscillospiraceae bacterium]